MRRAPIIVGDTVIDAIVGYRGWRIIVRDGQSELRSVYAQETRWQVGEPLEAECKCRSRRSVYEGGERIHTCGIYAYDFPVFGMQVPARAEQFFGHQFVYGEVYLWGEVIRHEKGYRGTVATPAGFYKPPGDSILARHVELAALQYDVALLMPPIIRP